MCKQNREYPVNETLFGNEKEWSIIMCSNMDETQNILLSEGNQSQKTTY